VAKKRKAGAPARSERLNRRYQRLRKRYSEVHGKVVDFISHDVEDGTLYFTVRHRSRAVRRNDRGYPRASGIQEVQDQAAEGLTCSIVKDEQIGNGQLKLLSHPIKGPERGRIPAAFDQAQEVHGHA
jgi:hypothetical protein